MVTKKTSKIIQQSDDTVTDDTGTSDYVVIKKYANRRLYNMAESHYITLEDLADLIRKGTHFIVYDAKTNEDITRSILTQIKHLNSITKK